MPSTTPRATSHRHLAPSGLSQNVSVPKDSLASPEGRRRLAALQAEFQQDPAKATRFFQEVGILDGKGKLTKRYGG